MDQIKTHSRQLVTEALSHMRNGEIDTLSVYNKDQFIGKVTYNELVSFLNHKEEAGDIYTHKLNFDIGTAMRIMKKTNVDLNHKGKLRVNYSKNLFIGLSAVAAISFLLISITRMFFVQDSLGPVDSDDISTLGKVTLKLADGRSIALNETKTGLMVANSILTYSDGSTINDQNSERSDQPILYKDRWGNILKSDRQMVLSVPAGGMYRVVLPDGSRVWLNAASSLKFPATFDGDTKRRVELNGEAYFEIAKVMVRPNGPSSKEQRMPFIVVTNTQEIEVLGTSFNVCAYDNEKSVRTTLIEGSIRLKPSIQMGKLPGTLDPSSLDPIQVENGSRTYGEAVVLIPNQESTLIGTTISIQNVDATEAFAWTDGEYIFRNASLETVMHTICRWYDVEVVYEDVKAGQELLGGAISRSSKIADVLEMLEVTANVHFKIEGKRITVIK